MIINLTLDQREGLKDFLQVQLQINQDMINDKNSHPADIDQWKFQSQIFQDILDQLTLDDVVEYLIEGNNQEDMATMLAERMTSDEIENIRRSIQKDKEILADRN